MEWKPGKPVVSQGYWALNVGDGYTTNTSGLWVPLGVTTSSITTFLPDHVYSAAVADVKHFFEHGDFVLDNATVYIPPKPKVEKVEAKIVGYYSSTYKYDNGYEEYEPNTRETLTGLFPGLDDLLGCPLCNNDGSSLTNTIIHLNDDHKWSRERIADWLETLPVDLTLVSASKGD